MNQRPGRDFRGDRQPEKRLEELWPDYLRGGYFDGKDEQEQPRLKIEYVAREKVEPLVREMSEAWPHLTMHQLRRFFQHCRAIEARLKQSSSQDEQAKLWASERANFAKLDSAAADAFGKSQKKIPRLFHDFIQRNVAAVKTEKDFLKGFLPHFEALVGFSAQHLNERDRN
jgi:CRISPR type III-A-associated protein Csm2